MHICAIFYAWLYGSSIDSPTTCLSGSSFASTICLLAYLRTLESALERLRRNLNETRESRLEAQSIHTTVLGRQYDNITQDLNMVTGDANTVLSMGEVFLDQAERNSREAGDIDDGLDRVEPGLGDVTEAARGALDEAATAQNNSQRVDELIQEIQVQRYDNTYCDSLLYQYWTVCRNYFQWQNH